MTVANDGDHGDAEPLRLDTSGVDGEASDDRVPDSRVDAHRWWWAWLIAAFVVGAVVSFVVANARHAAEEQAVVDVVLGSQALRDDEEPPVLEYAVLNVGPRPVGIRHVVPVGWNRAGSTQGEVRVVPGEWTTIETAVMANCDLRPDATVRVTAQSHGGVVSSHTTMPPALHDDLVAMWSASCPARPLVEITANVIEMTPTVDGRLVGSVELAPHGSEKSVRIVELRSRNAGFVAASPDVPLDLSDGEPTALTVEWRVHDCARALRLTEVRLEVTIAAAEPRAFVVEIPLDESAGLALARYSGGQCGT